MQLHCSRGYISAFTSFNISHMETAWISYLIDRIYTTQSLPWPISLRKIFRSSFIFISFPRSLFCVVDSVKLCSWEEKSIFTRIRIRHTRGVPREWKEFFFSFFYNYTLKRWENKILSRFSSHLFLCSATVQTHGLLPRLLSLPSTQHHRALLASLNETFFFTSYYIILLRKHFFYSIILHFSPSISW